jgi:hypothetical protein
LMCRYRSGHQIDVEHETSIRSPRTTTSCSQCLKLRSTGLSSKEYPPERGCSQHLHCLKNSANRAPWQTSPGSPCSLPPTMRPGRSPLQRA